MIGEAISNFIYYLIEVCRSVSKVASAETAWGILVLFGISIIISILDGNMKIRRPKLRHKDDEEDDSYELVLRRKRK